MVDYASNKLAGTFGAIQIGAGDHAVLIDIHARNYDTAGYLHTEHAHVRLPLNDAIRLHAVLAAQITAADVDPAQPALWGNATITQPVRSPSRYGWRV